jgi:putative transposase
VKAILERVAMSERRACRVAKCNRRMFRYKTRRLVDDGPLCRRLEELAAERRRFGYRRLAVLLRREGVVVNIKRIRRVYREANLQVRKRPKRRLGVPSRKGNYCTLRLLAK